MFGCGCPSRWMRRSCCRARSGKASRICRVNILPSAPMIRDAAAEFWRLAAVADRKSGSRGLGRVFRRGMAAIAEPPREFEPASAMV